MQVVKDAPENCQEKFPKFFRFFDSEPTPHIAATPARAITSRRATSGPLGIIAVRTVHDAPCATRRSLAFAP